MDFINFPEANDKIGKPEGWTDEQCLALQIFRGEVALPLPEGMTAEEAVMKSIETKSPIIVCALKPTPDELDDLIAGKPIYISFYSRTMPPVAVFTEYPFSFPEDAVPDPEDIFKDSQIDVRFITEDEQKAIERFLGGTPEGSPDMSITALHVQEGPLDLNMQIAEGMFGAMIEMERKPGITGDPLDETFTYPFLSFEPIPKEVWDNPQPGTIGEAEGQRCHRDGCQGIIANRPVKNCSCHINPPCSACLEDNRYCPECGWEGEEDA